jgi:hypothetical protein
VTPFHSYARPSRRNSEDIQDIRSYRATCGSSAERSGGHTDAERRVAASTNSAPLLADHDGGRVCVATWYSAASPTYVGATPRDIRAFLDDPIALLEHAAMRVRERDHGTA